MAERRLLVLGLGNVLCSDDGVGPAALARLLRRWEPPSGAEVLDGGTLGMRPPRGSLAATMATGEPPGWHAATPDEVLAALGSREDGLAPDEAERRLRQYGPNRLVVSRPVSAWRILLDQLRSLVMALLAAAAVVALAVGEVLDAVVIAAVLGVNVALGFWTEWGARRAMEGLKRLQVARARVERGGRELAIDAAGLVPGDLVVVEAGEAVPADGRLLSAAELRLVEAPLTGESFPVDKAVGAVPAETPLAERTSMVYKGTLVAAGRGRAVVTATGTRTEVGRISELVQETEEERTPLEERLDALGGRLVWLTLVVAAVVAAIGILRGGSVWLMVETGLALAVAAVPEGLPVVATIALAMGVRRMARRHALVRRLPAVESLGSTTVVCTDKTGTLTAGEMTVTVVWAGGREVAVEGAGYGLEGRFVDGEREVDPREDPALAAALRAGALVNRARVEQRTTADGRTEVDGDPTEAALLVAARKAGLARRELLAAEPEVEEVPFSSERMLMATFHRRGAGGLVAYVKGAPGRLVELSSEILTAGGARPLDAEGRRAVLAQNRRMAARGLRVLAVARRELPAGEAPGEAALAGLVFVGLLGLSDPPAEGVRETIARLHGAGVRTVMLTGDQRVTAEAVAGQLGVLRPGDETADGRDLAGLAPEELAARVGRIAAYSRVTPADKLEVVRALQVRGEIVGMLGDGVNDAPALKRADVGVAMGIRGTEVAKETADMVLADDRFETVGAAVEEGRVIFDNIRKFIFYLFSCNLSEVLVLLLGVLLGLPLPVVPLQILWLNLVTDVFPALALAVEPAEPDVMRRPPRHPQAAILSRGFLTLIGGYGLAMTAVVLGAFGWALASPGTSLGKARTVAFMTLALSQLFHVFNARSAEPVLFGRRLFENRWVWGAVALTLGLQVAVVYLPWLSRWFRTEPLAAGDWGVVLGASLVPLLAGQLYKTFRRRGASGASTAPRASATPAR